MSIAEVSLFRRNFNLRAPSVIAYESIETAPNTPVRIEMENVTGENREQHGVGRGSQVERDERDDQHA